MSYRFNTKAEVESLPKVDLAKLKKDRLLIDQWPVTLSWQRYGSDERSSVSLWMHLTGVNPRIVFSYTATDEEDEQHQLEYAAILVRTPCHFGGYRWWFRCPIMRGYVSCNRRVRALYFSGRYFGCRHCYSLTYQSRNKSRSALNQLFAYDDLEEQIAALQAQIRIPYYRGRPTRKQRRLEALYARLQRLPRML